MPQKQLESLWLKALLFSLAGYALMGKGFAYLFVGEAVLVLGFLIFLPTGKFYLLFNDPVLLLWMVFAILGFCRTVPFVSKYGVDAIRDAVLWGYGAFALLVVAFVRNSDQISRALNTYRKFLLWYFLLAPGLVFASTFLRNLVPTLPWAPTVNILMLRPSEAAVHLGAAAVFLLIFSDRRAGAKTAGPSILRILGFVGWSLAATMILIMTRAGFLGMMLPVALASLIRVQRVGWRVVALAVAGSILALTLLSSDLITVKLHGRAFSSEQVLDNVGSIFGGGHGRNPEGTKEWRLIWWTKIVKYTVFGPYRWTGRGFGINLAQEDGPPGISKEDKALRSPHNGSMTVLARTGVPGLAFWLALNAIFALRLFKAYRVANRRGSRFWSGVNLWILSYWFAAVINMSFDVYIEGPMGGILYWSIIGFGVAAMRIQRYEARQALAQLRHEAVEHELAVIPA